MLTRDEVVWGYPCILAATPRMRPSLKRVQRLCEMYRHVAMRSCNPPNLPEYACSRNDLAGSRRRYSMERAERSLCFIGCLHDAYEPVETWFIKAILRPNDVFVDVGANVSYEHDHRRRRSRACFQITLAGCLRSLNPTHQVGAVPKA
jgi:hypothetical protein